MQHDQQQGHGRCGGVETHELFRHDHVGRTGYRQQLRGALYQGRNQDFQRIDLHAHVQYVSPVEWIQPVTQGHGCPGRPVEREGNVVRPQVSAGEPAQSLTGLR